MTYQQQSHCGYAQLRQKRSRNILTQSTIKPAEMQFCHTWRLAEHTIDLTLGCRQAVLRITGSIELLPSKLVKHSVLDQFPEPSGFEAKLCALWCVIWDPAILGGM